MEGVKGQAAPEVIQLPLIAKHPAARLKPFAAVEVALPPLKFRYVPVNPPLNVVVEGEPKVAAPLAPLKERAATVLVASAVLVAR